MKSPSTPPLAPSDGNRVPDAVRVQILATEHWNLLGTRSMIWNEAFSRAAMFLTVLSGGVVALALVAQATAFGTGFRLFAIVVLPVVLLVGLGTFSRLDAINNEDFWLVAGMNRIRHAYLEIAPDLEQYFVTAHHDDIAGVWQTLDPNARPFGLGSMLAATPNVIAVIDSLVGGVLVDVIVETLGASVEVAAVAGGVAGAGMVAALLVPALRGISTQLRDYRPRFPRG